MRVLILSNFYPPSRSWGYTQLCHEVSQRLADNGHTIAVLTSNYLANAAANGQTPVYRLLHLDSDPLNYQPLLFFTRQGQWQKENQYSLALVVKEFQPDIIFIWGMWNMSKAVPAQAEALPGVSVIYYLSDHWPVLDSPHETYWRLPARRWYLWLFKQALNWLALQLLARLEKPQPLKFDHAICVSKTLRDSLVAQGAPVQQATIIYNGIDVEAFVHHGELPERPNSPGTPLRLLYAGRLSHEKGVHTAIASLAHLVGEGNGYNVSLTIVGDGAPGYVQTLHELVARHKVGQLVSFRPAVAREQMPALLSQFDVLVFPSIAAEALPRMPQEAMACGLVVVGTTTGGTQELLVEGENGLTFDPEDDRALAAQLLHLAADRDLRRKLAMNGRQTVLEKFTIERMVTDIEAYLYAVAGKTPMVKAGANTVGEPA